MIFVVNINSEEEGGESDRFELRLCLCFVSKELRKCKKKRVDLIDIFFKKEW